MTTPTQKNDNLLPDEVISPCSVRDIPAVVFGAVCFVLIVNFLLAFLLPGNPGYAVVQKKWDMLLNQQSPVDTVILGDSSGYLGVIPTPLEEKLAGPAKNFCSIGAMLAVNDAWMLDAYLEKFPPPKRVILVHVYDVLTTPVTPVTMSNAPQGKSQRFNLQMNLTLTEQARVWLNKFFPLYSENKSISSYLLKPWKKKSNALTKGREDGFCPVETGNPILVKSDAKIRLRKATGQNFHITEENRRALEYMVSLAEKKGFNLYIVNSPLYEELFTSKDFQRYYDQVQAELKKLASRNGRTFVLFDQPQLFPLDYMENSNHLLKKGAAIYSQRLADEILKLEQKQTASSAGSQR